MPPPRFAFPLPFPFPLPPDVPVAGVVVPDVPEVVEATIALTPLEADVEPAAFVAVTRIRIVMPTSAEVRL